MPRFCTKQAVKQKEGSFKIKLENVAGTYDRVNISDRAAALIMSNAVAGIKSEKENMNKTF